MKKEYQNLKILKTDDLKNILGIGRDKAYALMRSEAFPSTKIGKTCFVTEKILKSGSKIMLDANSNYRRYPMGKRNNGEGTFVTLAPNIIVHKICIGKNSNGKSKFLSVTSTTKTDCKRKMKARLDALIIFNFLSNFILHDEQ